MLIKSSPAIKESSVTDESVYLNRRQFMQGSLAAASLLAVPFSPFANAIEGDALKFVKTSYGKNDVPAPFEVITGYNNFYEFGTDKTDPKKYQGQLKTNPWNIRVTGMAEKTGSFHLEDILKQNPLEERIYRLRCVEAWSMVIPWVGFPLAKLLAQFKPQASAKYVAFETLEDAKQFPGQRSAFSSIPWPYQEGLRMDEAMHELSFMAVGLYGKSLYTQNGAPIRLVVPWKYGFKSIKSIVGIHFTDKQPATTWNRIAPSEYGFYANVNPQVDHPRWSQASERRLPSGLFDVKRIKTEMFNGYAEQVAHLYQGMDLRRNY